jgi:hypothetical protein
MIFPLTSHKVKSFFCYPVFNSNVTLCYFLLELNPLILISLP